MSESIHHLEAVTDAIGALRSRRLAQRLWDEADSVVIARIERVRADRNDYIGDTQRVSLRPVRTILTIPARSKRRKCHETSGWLIFSPRASSVTV